MTWILVAVALLVGYSVGYHHGRRTILGILRDVLGRRLAHLHADGMLLSARILAEVEGRPLGAPYRVVVDAAGRRDCRR